MSLSRSLKQAIVVGTAARVVPIVAFGLHRCMRDECGYRSLAKGILDGKGLETLLGWLWAPGYPYFLAAVQWLTGDVYLVKVPQVAMAAFSTWLLYRIATRVFDERSGLVAAWLYALHPTLVFFTGTLWSEVVYSTLLLSAVLSLLWTREGPAYRAILPGVLLGSCVLFRGVATYMAPIFVLASLWPTLTESYREAGRRRVKHALVMALSIFLTVAPYSVSVSQRHGGFILTDATLGQMMFMGANDFEPVTYDYGNGMNQNAMRRKYYRQGRPFCDKKMNAHDWNACEVANGKAWIKAHPVAFVRRMPMRVAQMMNPHTFLGRNLRWGKWAGIPWELKEFLCWFSVAYSFLVLIGGTLGAISARGAYGILAVGTVAYHVAAISLLAGLSRYRVPLEPLWIVYLAGLIAHPKQVWSLFLTERSRAVFTLLTTGVLLYLMCWYLPHGVPGWR